jgi:hypothetical protein
LRRAIENILGFEPTRRIVKAARFGLLMGGTAFVDFFVFRALVHIGSMFMLVMLE